ncbi:hypothetical protein ACFWYW_00100 [Nonomuraea sp. NPDC059023]|uniref:hypothetical protein n=1 Tax=unclassified Nonomuraea TaxID=2593643 RepID=UPI0036AC3082
MDGSGNQLRRAAVAVLIAGLGVLATGITLLALPSFATDRSESPLDSFPGFGKSPEAELRDDTIAYWEAYQQEAIIAACMSRAGFTYWRDTSFPEAETVKIASGLNAPQPRTVTKEQQVPATERNSTYEEQLAPQERDRYTRSRYGESAAEISDYRRTGAFPKGRGPDFAARGCVGQAKAAVPSIWDTKRQLEDERQVMRKEISASALNAVKSDYAACAQRVGGITAQSPAEVDAHAIQGAAQQQTGARVFGACNEIWARGYRAAEPVAAQRFIDRNAAVLTSAQQRYDGVIAKISQDRTFLQFLGEQAAIIRASGADRRPGD